MICDLYRGTSSLEALAPVEVARFVFDILTIVFDRKSLATSKADALQTYTQESDGVQAFNHVDIQSGHGVVLRSDALETLSLLSCARESSLTKIFTFEGSSGSGRG